MENNKEKINKITITQCFECIDITAIPNPNTGQGLTCCGYNCNTRKLDNVNEIPDWCPRLKKKRGKI